MMDLIYSVVAYRVSSIDQLTIYALDYIKKIVLEHMHNNICAGFKFSNLFEVVSSRHFYLQERGRLMTFTL